MSSVNETDWDFGGTTYIHTSGYSFKLSRPSSPEAAGRGAH
jgi:hypothetical protein